MKFIFYCKSDYFPYLYKNKLIKSLSIDKIRFIFMASNLIKHDRYSL